MSQSNPNPEERQRMVDAALKNSNFFREEKKDELQIIFDKMSHICNLAFQQMAPITEVALTNGSIHYLQGRRDWENTCTKLILDLMVKDGFSKEELMFLLAFTHAKRLVEKIA